MVPTSPTTESLDPDSPRINGRCVKQPSCPKGQRTSVFHLLSLSLIINKLTKVGWIYWLV